jgi:DNA-directed RNA polymerase subunit N (RpoN/RPB10)
MLSGGHRDRDIDPEYHFTGGIQPVRCYNCGEHLPLDASGYYRECAEIVKPTGEAHVIVHAECVKETDALA